MHAYLIVYSTAIDLLLALNLLAGPAVVGPLLDQHQQLLGGQEPWQPACAWAPPPPETSSRCVYYAPLQILTGAWFK